MKPHWAVMAFMAVMGFMVMAAAAAPLQEGADETEPLQPAQRPPGSLLNELLGRWYILEVWSNITSIDFGDECIFFEIERDPENGAGICIYKTDMFRNGTKHRDPLCLVHDHASDDWIKPGAGRRVAVLFAAGPHLALDAPIAADHWVLVLGRRARPAPAALRHIRRRLALGAPPSPVRLANAYPGNCDDLDA